MEIRLKRAYDPPAADDGFRVLTERLWPRGLTKEKARLDDWAKEWAPSPELRKWYGHQESLWPEFQVRYRRELMSRSDELELWARSLAEHPKVTFLYGSRGELVSSVVLRAVVEEIMA